MITLPFDDPMNRLLLQIHNFQGIITLALAILELLILSYHVYYYNNVF